MKMENGDLKIERTRFRPGWIWMNFALQMKTQRVANKKTVRSLYFQNWQKKSPSDFLQENTFIQIILKILKLISIISHLTVFP